MAEWDYIEVPKENEPSSEASGDSQAPESTGAYWTEVEQLCPKCKSHVGVDYVYCPRCGWAKMKPFIPEKHEEDRTESITHNDFEQKDSDKSGATWRLVRGLGCIAVCIWGLSVYGVYASVGAVSVYVIIVLALIFWVIPAIRSLIE